MTPKEFAKLVKRDGFCLHCGKSDDTLVPQHRKNRGMGGSKLLDNPSNLVLICSLFNGQIESSPPHAEFARKMGIKLLSWEDPKEVPVQFAGRFWLLDDNWGKLELPFFEG
jgi:hypothetical protein